MSAEDFKEHRSALAGMIWGWLESMNSERDVNWCEGTKSKLIKDTPFYTDDWHGEALLVRQTYPGARTTVEDADIDPDRFIEIRIGHTAEWIPVVRITSSLREHPLRDIVGGSEAALREAIRSVHDEIFCDWPLTEAEIKELIRRQIPDVSE